MALKTEELAVIERVSFGMTSTRGDDVPALVLVVNMVHSSAGIYFYEDAALEFIRQNNIRYIDQLVNKVCVVSSCGLGTSVEYVRMFSDLSV
jgi:hypothetical protein